MTESALSPCLACEAPVPATLTWNGDSQGFLVKSCPIHGVSTALISTDREYTKSVENSWQKTQESADASSPPLMIFLEIIDECDLACSTCIAGSMKGLGNARAVTEIDQRLRAATLTGKIDCLFITGGEPTLHPDLPAILATAAKFTRQLFLITNGVRIANEPEYLKLLASSSDNLQIYLQFDSLRADALIHLRGHDLSSVRLNALKNLSACSVLTTLVSVVKKGVNDQDIVPTVQTALEYDNVVGITFQPLRATGRHPSYNYDEHNIVLTEVRRRLIDELRLPSGSLTPHPADPFRVSIGYYCRDSFTTHTPAVIYACGDQPSLYATIHQQELAAPSVRLLRLAIISYYDQHDIIFGTGRPAGIQFLLENGRLISLEERFLTHKNPSVQPITFRSR